MPEVSKGDLFEAAFIGARRNQRGNYHITELECSDYEKGQTIQKKPGIRSEIPVAVIGGFALDNRLITDEIVRDQGLAEYGIGLSDAASRVGTHLDEVTKETQTYNGNRLEYFSQTFLAADVDKLAVEGSENNLHFVGGALTLFQPVSGMFRSIFIYHKKLNDTKRFVQAKAAEDSSSELTQAPNTIYDIAAIESPESRILLARAAASCLVRVSGCAGVLLSNESSQN